jgi:iron complex outermembrane receptor protein
MRARRLVIGLIACALVSSRAADAQAPTVRTGTIDGVVTDTMLVPLPGSTVSIIGSNVRVVTGDNGRFRISALQPGEYVVIAHRLGFEPLSARIQVTVTDTARLAFSLDRVVTRLDTVVVDEPAVVARFADFESRRKNHQATASFTAEDIRKVNPVDAWQMLSRVPAMKLVPSSKQIGGGLLPVSNRGMKVDRTGAGPCFMSVMIDGVTMIPTPPDLAFDLRRLPAPDEIHGIEIFAGPGSIPPQYNGAGNDKRCGLVAIWTK